MITMEGKYQTRGSAKYPSLPVRILATDMKGVDGTVIGLITEPSGWQYPACWKADGKALELGVTESFADLIPAPTKHEGWVIISRKTGLPLADNCRGIWMDRSDAVAFCNEAYNFVAHVTWED